MPSTFTDISLVPRLLAEIGVLALTNRLLFVEVAHQPPEERFDGAFWRKGSVLLERKGSDLESSGEERHSIAQRKAVFLLQNAAFPPQNAAFPPQNAAFPL